MHVTEERKKKLTSEHKADSKCLNFAYMYTKDFIRPNYTQIVKVYVKSNKLMNTLGGSKRTNLL